MLIVLGQMLIEATGLLLLLVFSLVYECSVFARLVDGFRPCKPRHRCIRSTNSLHFIPVSRAILFKWYMRYMHSMHKMDAWCMSESFDRLISSYDICPHSCDKRLEQRLTSALSMLIIMTCKNKRKTYQICNRCYYGAISLVRSTRKSIRIVNFSGATRSPWWNHVSLWISWSVRMGCRKIWSSCTNVSCWSVVCADAV